MTVAYFQSDTIDTIETVVGAVGQRDGDEQAWAEAVADPEFSADVDAFRAQAEPVDREMMLGADGR